ncbi:MAG: hypothetical protein R3D00_16325 [Bacteroidia bacterium]
MKYLIAIVLLITLFSCYQPKSTYKIEVKDLEEFERVYLSMDTLLRKINEKGCPDDSPCDFSFIEDILFVGTHRYKVSENFKHSDSLFENFTPEEFSLLQKNMSFMLKERIAGIGPEICNSRLFLYKQTDRDEWYDTEFLTYVESEEQYHCLEDNFFVRVFDRKGNIVLVVGKD